MYPIELESMLDEKNECLKKPILFFSCIGFEERCKTAARRIFSSMSSSNNLDIIWGFFEFIYNGSYYEKECFLKKNRISDEIMELIHDSRHVIPKFKLFDSQPWEDMIFYFKEIITENQRIETVIFDITTVPEVCYIPFLKWLIVKGLGSRDLIICYTKPNVYGGSKMQSDPTTPSLLIGDIEKGRDILWIPLLGFKSTFTKTILEKLREMDRGVEIKIIPMIGVSSNRPDYFKEYLILHAKEEDIQLIESLKNPILAREDDPFDVYDKIMEIAKNFHNKNIILSPLGPKSMAIGFALAAIKLNLPIFSIQPRTYHPDYSIGEGTTSVYWIKRDGAYTFNH